MNILISGGSGLIGSALSRRLVERGDQVVRLVRVVSPTSSIHGSNQDKAVEKDLQVQWNPAQGWLDWSRLESIGRIDAVINLSGAGIGDKRWSNRRRTEILDSRINSTRLIAQSISKLNEPPSVFVSASAIGFYGDRGDEELDESSLPGSGFLAEVCQAWEDAASKTITSETRLVLLRSGVVLSASGGALKRQLRIFRLGLGGCLGDGSQYLSWISLHDEVSIIVSAIDDSRISGPINATSPLPVTNLEFSHALGSVLHRPVLVHVPKRMLGYALGLDLANELLLASQRVLPKKLLSLGFEFRDSEIQKALAAIIAEKSSSLDPK